MLDKVETGHVGPATVVCFATTHVTPVSGSQTVLILNLMVLSCLKDLF